MKQFSVTVKEAAKGAEEGCLERDRKGSSLAGGASSTHTRGGCLRPKYMSEASPKGLECRTECCGPVQEQIIMTLMNTDLVWPLNVQGIRQSASAST